jgi:hypothetical protein
MPQFSQDDVTSWREDGFSIIPGFFSALEIAPLRADFEKLYGKTGANSDSQKVLDASSNAGVLGEFRTAQFRNIDTLPYKGSSELNLISLHPALIEFAKVLLGVEQVHLYQSHTWAKFTGEADYSQDFHCDFSNHTLVVPSDVPALRTVDFVVYLTDVTDEHGALHYVPKGDCEKIMGPGRIGAFDAEKQQALQNKSVSAASSAGTLLAHGIDTFHRGTNLTLEGGYRYTMTIGYKAAGNDMIGYHAWQQTGDNDWSPVLNHGSPAQLACLGIPMPGDAYWTERTLKLTNARWPDWDMAEYFEGLD